MKCKTNLETIHYKYTTTIVETPQEASQAIQDYDFTEVAFDTETTGLDYTERNIWGGEYGTGEHQPTGLSFFNGRHALYIDTSGWGRPVAKQLFKELNSALQDQCETVIAHNLPFDLAAAHKAGIKLWNKQLRDTLTASHLLDENRNKKHGGPGNGLKQLAQEFLGESEPVPWRIAKRNKETFRKYAVNDAVWTYRLYDKFNRELKYEDLWGLYTKIEMPFQVCLAQMDVQGVKVDLDKVFERTESLYEDIASLEKAMYNSLGYQRVPENKMLRPGQYKVRTYTYDQTLFTQEKTPKPKRVVEGPLDWGSYPSMVELFTEDLGLELTETTKNDNISIKEVYLEPFKDEHDFVELYLEYKKATKLLSSFFEPLPKQLSQDDKARANWHNTGTRTGRLSCSQPNLQQTPNPSNDDYGVRECYIAEEGYKLVACDYSGQENCVLAHVSQDEKLMSILKNGLDLHLSVANEFYNLGIPEEKLNKNHPDFKQLKEVEYKEDRSDAKTITFGLAYGKSGYGFAKDFDIPEEEGEQIVEDYKNKFPGVKQAMDQCDRDVENQGYVTHCLGRKRRFTPGDWGGYSDRSKRQAFNFLIQGASADMIRLASARTMKLQGRNPEWDLKMVMTVHDESVYQVKEEYVEEAAGAIQECFESLSELFTVPLEADVSWGDTYAHCK